MEAVAPGKDHHYFNHKPSSARPLFYAHMDNCNHNNAIEERSLHDYCGSILGARAGSHGADGTGHNGEESSGSPNFTGSFMSEGSMSNRNGQGSANGYCPDAVAEQRLTSEFMCRTHSHTSVESCSKAENPQQINAQDNEELHDDKLVTEKITQSQDSVENCGKAENSQRINEANNEESHDDKFVKEKITESQDSVENCGKADKPQPNDVQNNEEIHDDKFVKEKIIQSQDSVENCGKVENSQPINGNNDEESHDNKFVKENTTESQDSDFELIENFDGQHVSPHEAPENKEVLEYDVSQCYSPGEWSSRASTDSALSPLTSPLLAAWPSPVYNRCRTAPIGPSSCLNLEEASPNFLRSKTDKERKQRSSETLYHTPSPAERLSERKRKKIIENLVKIKNDGTVEVDVDRGSEIAPTLFDLDGADQLPADIEEDYKDPVEDIPSYLEIAMLIVGTRGDVQPFVAIGKRLRDKGHRVRLATHANFRNFVTSNGLEFYPLGGDPKILAGYMVKNKGFLPSGPSEISIQKKQLKAIMHSLLPACTKPDGDSGAPFRASAIIANPPAYGHVHVAECLDVPIHIFFTMPWTPTNEFPHPLARVKRQAGYKMSYHVVDSLMWWGMRGLINEFRVKELKLNPMTYFNMNQGSIAHLPTGYMWSPHLVPKPKDWGPRVDVVGFCFLSLADNYTPPNALVKWLAEGEKPIYVGFGSLPVEQPGKMTEIIVRALRETKHRGIIDKGWGGLGDLKEPPDSIFLLENCPHDWLFPQCAAVVHHGGAGTTAAGLKAGCPTTIVPFFGDQPFWGERVCAKGVGPAPIPVQQFTLERLVQAINFMQDPEVKQKALELAIEMEEEDGVGGAVDAFYRHWAGRSTQVTLAKERLSIIQRAFIGVQRLWCLPWCFE